MKNLDCIDSCKKAVWRYYHDHKREMPWRPPLLPIQKNDQLDAYSIFISEVMLQQTQVNRVMKMFPKFLNIFPSFETLAQASLSDVLYVWQGMGYNRRAQYLKKSAEVVIKKFNGILPHDPLVLETLPGIGPGTAGSIVTFVFNKPEVFIETNIRRVMIHHFFSDKEGVEDHELIPFVKKTLDTKNPREWYYALVDYGSWLGKEIPNPNRKSKHYTKQSKFEGSDRQVRGKILKILLVHGTIQKDSLEKLIAIPQKRLQSIIDGLIGEKIVIMTEEWYKINNH